MKIVLRYFLKLLLFLLCLFIAERIIFLLFQLSAIKAIPFTEVLLVFTHAFAMDVATACAVLLPVFLLLGIYLFARKNIFLKIIRYYISGIIIFTGFINLCDIALYREWGTRINQKAISYLAYPKEAFASAWSMQYLFALIAFIVLCIVFIRLYKSWFRKEVVVTGKTVSKIVFLLLTPFVLVIGIRGGFQGFPLDRSWVYFSRHAVLNQAAVNSSWNFIHAVTDPVDLKSNPYNFFSAEEAKLLFAEAHKAGPDSTVQILNTNRPNIVLVMVESLSAEMIEELGGKKGITPNISELIKEGLLFPEFYTPGFRTEQGLAALVSGFPSQPTTTIIRQFGKFEKLPSIARTLDSAGYTSSYYYGGNLHFAFTESYLQAMGFDKIIGENDFAFKKKTDWGAYDEELFQFFNTDMKETKQPFFSMIMTSTNHEPFDADVEKIVESKAGDWCQDYVNTVHYTDKCLGELVAGIKKQSWYNNTVIAIVSDHAHSCPGKFEYNSAPRHHIPFLLLGGALKEEYRGKINNHLSSQVDFPASILSLLGLNHDQFRWSKNIFNSSSPEFVFYSFDDGFGWIQNHQQLVYDHKLKQVISPESDSLTKDGNGTHLKYGKAYLQVLMDEYMRFNEK